MIELDHLVLAARTLDEGARFLRKRLGVELEPGGQHAGFGTHNALLRLGADVYLEVLAPDPAQPAPSRGRLFGLDEEETRALLERGPALLHWVVRTRDLGTALRELAQVAGVAPAAIGVPTAMQRGSLHWTLAVPADRSRPPLGLPSLIDWAGAPHPCSRLPDRGVRLERFAVTAPAATVAALAELRSDARVALSEGEQPCLLAELVSPQARATLA